MTPNNRFWKFNWNFVKSSEGKLSSEFTAPFDDKKKRLRIIMDIVFCKINFFIFNKLLEFLYFINLF